jgi:hypothetical protein
VLIKIQSDIRQHSLLTVFDMMHTKAFTDECRGVRRASFRSIEGMIRSTTATSIMPLIHASKPNKSEIHCTINKHGRAMSHEMTGPFSEL